MLCSPHIQLFSGSACLPAWLPEASWVDDLTRGCRRGTPLATRSQGSPSAELHLHSHWNVTKRHHVHVSQRNPTCTPTRVLCLYTSKHMLLKAGKQRYITCVTSYSSSRDMPASAARSTAPSLESLHGLPGGLVLTRAAWQLDATDYIM